MPQIDPLNRKEYNKLYYMKNAKKKTTRYEDIGTQTDPIPNKILVKRIKPRVSREQIILFYYDMIKLDREFAVWIRNIRRVNIEFLHSRGT